MMKISFLAFAVQPELTLQYSVVHNHNELLLSGPEEAANEV